MSKIVEKSGIYREENGRAIKLFAGAVITDEQAAKYGVGSDAEIDELDAEIDELDAEIDELDAESLANPTDEIPATPTGEKQEGAPDAGAEVRDGVIADGDGGEIGAPSAEVAERDASPVDGSSVVQEVRELGPAPENRMQPPAPENRMQPPAPENRAKARRRKASDAVSDVELAQEENAPVVSVEAVDSLDNRDAK